MARARRRHEIDPSDDDGLDLHSEEVAYITTPWLRGGPGDLRLISPSASVGREAEVGRHRTGGGGGREKARRASLGGGKP